MAENSTAQAQTSMASQWSHLPAEILAIIAKRLDDVAGNLRLRSVCPNWRAAVPLLEPESSFKFPYPDFILPRYYGHFSLTISSIYLLRSATTSSPSPWWLLRVERNGGKFRPLSPFSRTMTMDDVPKTFPRGFNLLDVRIRGIGKVYSLDFFEGGETIETNTYRMRTRKVVMSSVRWTRNSGGEDYAILALFSGKLAFIQLGDEKWSQIDDPYGSVFDDILYSKEKHVFYAVNRWGRLVMIDSELKAKEIVSGMRFDIGGNRYKYMMNLSGELLVESNGELFFVNKHTEPELYMSDDLDAFEIDGYSFKYTNLEFPLHLKVYKLNERMKNWEYVHSLGDRVFLIGDDWSHDLSAQNIGLEGNCIYFADECFIDDNEKDANLGDICIDAGIFCLKDGSCGSLASFPDRSTLFLNSPAWLNGRKTKAGKSEGKSLAISEGVKVAENVAQPMPSQWSNLPDGILVMISNILDSVVSNLRLRSVCLNWRAAIPLLRPATSPFSFKLPYPAFVDPIHIGHFLLSYNTIYLLQPAAVEGNEAAQHSLSWWLLRTEGKGDFGKFRPLSPFSKTMTMDVIPKTFPKGLNLLDVQIHEISKAYSLDFFELGDTVETNTYRMRTRKVVMSSVPWTTDSGERGYAILALFTGKLGLIQFGDENWSQIYDPNESIFYDILYSEEKKVFYAVNRWGRLIMIDRDLKAKEIVSGMHFDIRGNRDKYIMNLSGELLIESNGELFFVNKHVLDYSNLEFPFRLEVYKLNERKENWEYVHSLGEQVFFIGDDCSFAVSAQCFGLEGNCIYFADECFVYHNDKDGNFGDICIDAGIFCLKDGSCGSLASFPDRSQIFLNSPAWLKGPETKADKPRGKKSRKYKGKRRGSKK